MDEILGVVGSALGGGFLGVLARILPEVFAFFNRRSDNKHELEMFKLQIEADKMRAVQKMELAEVQGQISLDHAGLDALREALRGQSEMAVASGSIGALISAAVRPTITYLLLLLYLVAKCFHIYMAVRSGSSLDVVTGTIYDGNDVALFTGVVNFWFLDRVIKRRYQ